MTLGVGASSRERKRSKCPCLPTKTQRPGRVHVQASSLVCADVNHILSHILVHISRHVRFIGATCHILWSVCMIDIMPIQKDRCIQLDTAADLVVCCTGWGASASPVFLAAGGSHPDGAEAAARRGDPRHRRLPPQPHHRATGAPPSRDERPRQEAVGCRPLCRASFCLCFTLYDTMIRRQFVSVLIDEHSNPKSLMTTSSMFRGLLIVPSLR